MTVILLGDRSQSTCMHKDCNPKNYGGVQTTYIMHVSMHHLKSFSSTYVTKSISILLLFSKTLEREELFEENPAFIF